MILITSVVILFDPVSSQQNSCTSMGKVGNCTCGGHFCNGIATLVNVSTIRNIFENLSVGPLESVEIAYISDSGLPPNFLGINKVKKISLQCYSSDPVFEIHSLAFEDPTNYTKDFSIYWCQLENVEFIRHMPALTVIHLDHIVPVVTDKTRPLDFSVLNGKNLLNFTCIQCGIKQFPAVLAFMGNLLTVDLSDNLIRSLPDGSVTISSHLTTLNFTSCPIYKVQERAFIGNRINFIYGTNYFEMCFNRRLL